jgi:tetratricopeptide (TPR) repeat protein
MKRFSTALAATILLLGAQDVLAQGNKLTSAAKYNDDGAYDKALEALDEARRHESTSQNPRTYYALSQTYVGIALDTTGRFAGLVADPLLEAKESLKLARKYDDRGREKSRVVPQADRLSRMLYNAGLTNYREQAYHDAYKRFKAAYETYGVIVGYGSAEGRDTSTYYFAAICADLAGNKDTAEAMYKRLISWDVQEPGVYGNLGKLYLGQEQFGKAEAVFAEGRSRFPTNQDLLIDELNYYLGQGRAPEAIDKFEQAIANDPDNPELYFAMGTAYQALIKLDSANAQQHMASAREAYGKTIELNPNSFDAYLNTGALFYNEGVLIQNALDEVDINDMETAQKLEAERNRLYGEALPFFEKAAETYENMPEDEKIPLFYAVEVYRSLKEINIRLGNYDAGSKAKTRMEELKAQLDAQGQ